MPTIFSHALVAGALGIGYGAHQSRRFWVLAVLCAVLPDADVIAFAFGIPYAHMLGHRGLTHSFAFAALTGWIVVTMFFSTIPRGTRPWWGLVAFFALVTASHGVLDALTNGGLGVAFFAPFDGTRYFFPWQPIRVSPIGVASFFTARGWATLQSELVWIWLPAGASVGVLLLWRWARRKRNVHE